MGHLSRHRWGAQSTLEAGTLRRGHYRATLRRVTIGAVRTLRKLLNWIVFAVVVVGAVLYVRSLGGEGYDVPSPAEATGKHLAECNAWRQEYERTLAFDLFFKLREEYDQTHAA